MGPAGVRKLLRPAWWSLVLAAASFGAVPVARAQGVDVAVQPAAQTVAPGAEFELSIEVTRAGSPFNGFDLYVAFDPDALTPIPLSPLSEQEGTYFKGACASRFHLFKTGAGRDTITSVLLCNGVSVTGPGQIYRLRFKASTTPQVTSVQLLPQVQFYNAGLYVNPDTTHGATIGIGMPLAAASAGAAMRPRLEAHPNPARGGVAFRIEMDRAGPQELIVRDVMGRVVRRLASGAFPAGARVVAWDGRSDSGLVVPPGVYLGALRASGRTFEARFTMLK